VASQGVRGFESLSFLMNYEDLYPRFENLLIELASILHGKVSSILMEDLEFFIVDPYVNPTCSTNTSLAYRLGSLSANGINFVAVKALVALFAARDSMLKGFPVAVVQDWLAKSENFVKTYNLYESMELNLG
jgi:hypothetical protein